MNDAEPVREPDAADVAQQIESLRSEIGDLVRELDRRRHDAFDLRLQLRRHRGSLAIAAAGIVLIATARVAAARERRSISQRAANLVRVLALLSNEDPAVVRHAVRRSSRGSGLASLATLAVRFIPPLRPTRSSTAV